MAKALQPKEKTRIYLRPKEIAKIYRVSESVLAQWRCQDKGPPYYKPSATIVLYRQDQFEAWLNTTMLDPKGG